MGPDVRICRGDDVLVVDVEGRLDLEESKQGIRRLSRHLEHEGARGILFDLRDVRCELSVLDVYQLASLLAWPDPALPTGRAVAVVVPETKKFDHPRFFEICARNRGLDVRSFETYDPAWQWLHGKQSHTEETRRG